MMDALQGAALPFGMFKVSRCNIISREVAAGSLMLDKATIVCNLRGQWTITL